jgi:hypothetical protein
MEDAPNEQSPKLTNPESRERITHEDDLVNHRVSWLIGSQSFLLTAFVLLRNNPQYFTATDPDYLKCTSALIFFIAGVGFLIAVCSFAGVFAAFFAIRKWRSFAPKDGRTELTSRSFIAWTGGVASVLPAPVVASVWVLLLTSEWARISSHISAVTLFVPVAVTALVVVIWSLFFWRYRILIAMPRD